jgi:hypothetical protein
MPECTTLKSSIILNTRRTGSACQSNMISSVPSNPWVLHCGYYVYEHLRTRGQYKVNRKDVSYHYFMYLYFVSPNFSLLTYFFFLLHQFSNYRVEWNYPFTKDMQNSGVNNVISDICMFLCREIFHVEGAFFNKNGMLA